MKRIWCLAILVFSLEGIALCQSYRKEADIRKGPLDMVEYYLIIPGNPYPYVGDDKEFTEFEYRKKYLRPMPDMDVIVDNKNAYMEILDRTQELEYRMQLTWFKKADGSRIIAVHEYQAGGDCDSRSLTFYTYENQKFIDVTALVFPKLKMTDFCPAGPLQKFSIFEPVYELPRYGTSIKTKADPVCEQDEKMRGIKAEQYYNYFKDLGCREIEVAWDKTKGKFFVKPRK